MKHTKTRTLRVGPLRKGTVMIDPDIRADIMQRLSNAETEHGVKILYAVESGSRAWGFESKDSDYDVRFVYARKPDDYLALQGAPRDTIEYPITDHVDINGWDVSKAMQLFGKSNPTICEWLRSPEVYIQNGTWADEARNLMAETYNVGAGTHHYASMARKNIYKYLSGPAAQPVNLKKYLYAIRPALAAAWLSEGRGMPPIELHRLMELVTDQDVIEAVEDLLKLKRSGNEDLTGPRNEVLDDMLATTMEGLAVHEDKKHQPDWEPLNRLFLKTIGVRS